ncbi:hypothetical protein EDF85_1389 [Pseudomonas putida]|uniref:Uncharacterized protein n=1 Tax=Pseudomonas putida TaxID=303 RepID=A0A9X8EN31_PSEPU|nr:hypothetical protein EDF85_1389 [Pseudomonas putida]
MATSSKNNDGDKKAIEASIKRSLRIALAAILVIALVIPITESIFVNSATRAFVMRSIDFIALVTMILSFSNALLLDQRLNKSAGL